MAKSAKPSVLKKKKTPSLKRKSLPNAQNMTQERWKKVISAYAHGANREEAAKAANITVQTIEAYLISNVTAMKQIRDAQLVHLRKKFSSELLDNIFTDLASGLSLKRAALKHGLDKKELSSLYRLVRKDRAIREAYDEARELWAESFLDDNIDIADDSGDDRMDNGKINHEVVNRSKLRIETRWRAMGAMVKKRFGDHKHIEHGGDVQINHIALLTGARKRVESRQLPPVKERVTIDNETGDID